MSSNLYKAGWFVVDDSARVIDSNKLMEKRLKKAAESHACEEKQQEEKEEGFQSGLDADTVDVLLSPDGSGEIIKNAALEEQAALDRELEKARNELERVRAEADQMLQNASAQIEEMRRNTLEEAKDQGYKDGYEQGMAQVQAMKDDYLSQKEELEREYHHKIEELEPEFVRNLTEIYEHVFKVDLSVYSQIVSNLLIDAMQKTDSAKNYIVHVSKKDYAKVCEERERIQEETGTLADNLEIVSDMTLSPSQCMIETESGIYDCSLGVELEELKRKLKLFSYRSM